MRVERRKENMSKQERSKTKIELLHVGDGRTFLNYWDFNRGNDVCCELINGRLWQSQHGDDGEEKPPIQISLKQFVDKVTESINS